MLLPKFREAVLDQLLTFLWRQWSTLGVLGYSRAEEKWIIDPEPLLVFSLEMGRYEPRLFDEILAWLEVNGRWLDTARLRRILKNQNESTVRVMGGALQHALSRGDKRKWGNLTHFCKSLYKRQPNADSFEPLFRERSGKPHPFALPDNMDSDFSIFYINRPKIKNLKEAKEVPLNANTNLRFLLRPLLGTGAKSETILYLLTHEGGRPREIADSVGLFWMSVQQALSDLSRSGLVLTKPIGGKKIEYWLSQPKWWQFLASTDFQFATGPQWLDWIAIYSAFSTLWGTIDEIALGTQSDYMKSSKLQDSLEGMAREFSRAGYYVGTLPSMGLPPELHQQMAMKFLNTLFDLQVRASEVSASV